MEFGLGQYLKGGARRYRDCLEACVDCSVMCKARIELPLELEGVEARARFVRACLDCAAACVACVIIIPCEPGLPGSYAWLVPNYPTGAQVTVKDSGRSVSAVAKRRAVAV